MTDHRRALFLGAGLLIGCGDAATRGTEDELKESPSSAEKHACEEGRFADDENGDRVLRCTTPFASAPMVRLPADELDGAVAKFYAGVSLPIDFSGQFVIWTRKGERYLPVDSEDAPIAFTDGDRLPKGLQAPTNRVTFTIYQFTGEIGGDIDSPYGPATAIDLKSARPVVEIDGCAFDGRLLGTWSGTVSERIEDAPDSAFGKTFDEAKRVPIHLTLASIRKNPSLAEYDGSGNLDDAPTYLMDGTLDNFDRDVEQDGATYPSLTAMGGRDPFLGATDGKIQLYRLGNMHGQMNDGHWVFTYPAGSKSLTGNGMSFTLTAFTAPGYLFEDGVTGDPFRTVEIRPHIPFVTNGHSVTLSPLKIASGSEKCAD